MNLEEEGKSRRGGKNWGGGIGQRVYEIGQALWNLKYERVTPQKISWYVIHLQTSLCKNKFGNRFGKLKKNQVKSEGGKIGQAVILLVDKIEVEGASAG